MYRNTYSAKQNHGNPSIARVGFLSGRDQCQRYHLVRYTSVNKARSVDACLPTCIEVDIHCLNIQNVYQRFVQTSQYPRASVLVDSMECGMYGSDKEGLRLIGSALTWGPCTRGRDCLLAFNCPTSYNLCHHHHTLPQPKIQNVLTLLEYLSSSVRLTETHSQYP